MLGNADNLPRRQTILKLDFSVLFVECESDDFSNHSTTQHKPLFTRESLD